MNLMAQIDRTQVVVGSVLGTALVGGISGETIQSIATIGAAVAAVVGALAWLDARFDSKIKAHATEEEHLALARSQALVAEIKLMLVQK